MAKIKMKTNRSAAKRLKVSGTGKIMRMKGGKRHLLTTKNSSRKNRLGGPVEIDKDNVRTMRKLIPYGL